MYRTRAVLAGCVTPLALGMVVVAAAPTSAQGPPLLLFSSNRATDYHSEVYARDLTGGAVRDISRNPHEGDELLAVRGDDVLFIADGNPGAVYVASGRSGTLGRLLARLPDATGAVGAGWSSRSGMVALSTTSSTPPYYKAQILLIDGSGRPVARIPNSSFATRDPGYGFAIDQSARSMWSADGTRLSYAVGKPGAGTHKLRVSDARGRLVFARHGDHAFWASAAPRLVITRGGEASDGPVGSTVVQDEQGHLIRQVAGRALAISPDGGTLVVTHAKTTALVNVTSGSSRKLPGSAISVSFSPDGARVEVVNQIGPTLIVAVPSGRVLLRRADAGPWLADGRLVVLDEGSGTVLAAIVSKTGRVLRRLPLVPPEDDVGRYAVTRNGTLVYTAQSVGAHQLYEQSPTGELVQLTRGTLDHQYPDVSRDGLRIADEEYQAPCGICYPWTIATFPSDGATAPQALPGQGDNDHHPTWSPDGTLLAYWSFSSNVTKIIVARADGSSSVAVATVAGGNSDPAWSPDGSAIAASRLDTGGDGSGIFVMAPDGSSAHVLTGAVPFGSDISETRAPSWSPDSSQLAFAGADGLYLIGRDGSQLHRIVAMQSITGVAWSPDGARIAFSAAVRASDTSLANDIWMVHPDGTGLVQVTNDDADDVSPAWIPAR